MEAQPMNQSPTPARRDLETFAERMFAKDVAEWMDISVKRFYALEAEGRFFFAEHRPRIGRKSWSRERLKQWDRGELKGLTGRKFSIAS
jgi:hypothetical protein